MSKIVYFLLIVTLATLITARPADDKKPDAAKDAAKDAKDAADKGKDGATDAAKKAEDALKDKAKDPAGGKKKGPSFDKIPEDFTKIAQDTGSLVSDFGLGFFGK